MKKIVYLLGLIIISACTDRLALEEKPSGGSWNLTVRASKNSEFTKALSESGTTLLASFSEGDKVYVYKPEESSSGFLAILSATKIGELTAQSSGASTTFTGSVDNSNFSVGDQLLLAYCGVTRNYSKQDGTLATIAKNCDYAYASLNIQTLDSGTKKITTNAATFQNQQAVLKLTFQDLEGKPLTIKTLTVGGTGGNNLCDLGLSILGALNITLTNPSTVVYAALHNIHQGVEESYTFTAKDTDDEEWICRKKVAFLDGKFYTSTLKMTRKSEWVEPYVTTISSVDDLMLFAEHMNSGTVNYYGKTVTLTSDLDLAGVPFVPIGSNKPFAGTFDGGGHTIRNLEINKPDADGVGFFKTLCAATSNIVGIVKDLHLENCSITGKNSVGGISGDCPSNQHSDLASISGCTVSGTITGNSFVGGIIGVVGHVNITNCTNSSVVTGVKYVGGIGGGNDEAGDAHGTVTGCVNTGAVTASGPCVGGLFGGITQVLPYFGGIFNIENCTNQGTVNATGGSASYNCGGLVGQLSSAAGEIRNSVNQGAVVGSDGSLNIGGLIGHMYGNKSNVINCVNEGAVSGTERIGGLVGKTTNAPAEVFGECFNKGVVTGSSLVGELCGTQTTPIGNTFSDCFYYTGSSSCGAVEGADVAGTARVFKIIAGAGVTVSVDTTGDYEYGGAKYYVSGKTVTITLSGGTDYTAADGNSNPIGLTNNGGGSYTLTMPASDVTISAN